jgi:hypothetical protein
MRHTERRSRTCGRRRERERDRERNRERERERERERAAERLTVFILASTADFRIPRIFSFEALHWKASKGMTFAPFAKIGMLLTLK